MTNLTSPLAQLDSAMQVLHQRWEHTKTMWNDKVRRGFEDDYWTPLEKQTRATQHEIEKLAQVIAQAQRSVK